MTIAQIEAVARGSMGNNPSPSNDMAMPVSTASTENAFAPSRAPVAKLISKTQGSEKRRRFTGIITLTLLCMSLLIACARAPTPVSVTDQRPEFETLPMIALEGYRDASNFYVKYSRGGRVLYSGGSWLDRIQLVESPAPATPGYATPSLLPMQYHQETRWESIPADAINIPILAVEQWQLLRERLLRGVVPGNGEGLVVDFGYVEYFLYYDREGEFQATRLVDKPADYSINRSLRFEEFMTRGRPVLDRFLAEQGITQTEFVFNTGDAGLYSLPFLYVNTERHLLVFVRFVPMQPGAVVAMPGLKSSQALGHVLRSHLSNLLLRPVSSLYRLFFVVTDTAVSTVRFDWVTGLNDKPVPPLGNSAPMDLHRWEEDLDRISRHPLTSGTTDILVDGEAFFTRLIDAITAARESIYLQTYIFDNDDYAIQIAELLKQRSNDGLEVKILLDGLGTIAGTMTDSETVPEQHLPPASVRQFLESGSRLKLRQKANPWFTGDHVKSTIIDEEVAFVGGMNIGREYRYDWHDLMMELRGPVVESISREFKLAWGHAGPLGDLGYLIAQASTPDVSPGTGEGYPLRLLLTGPGNYEIYQAQLQAIQRAQSYIYLQNAYFTDDSLLRELVMARRRGVDVRVIIPMETDYGAINRSNILAVNLMLKQGIRVYIYPGFSHVKAAIYDGWVCLGSANFDRLSLRLNRELNIASSHPELARQLRERLFEPDFLISPELTEPIPARWIDHLVEIVGDYLY